MSTPPPRGVSLSQGDLANLVNSSVAAGITAFQQAQASTPAPPASVSPVGTVAGLDSVDVVGLKLGTFWTDMPTIWFMQAEAQFRLKKITVEETMYHHVLVALDNRTSAEVEYVIEGTSQANKPLLTRQAEGRRELLK